MRVDVVVETAILGIVGVNTLTAPTPPARGSYAESTPRSHDAPDPAPTGPPSGPPVGQLPEPQPPPASGKRTRTRRPRGAAASDCRHRGVGRVAHRSAPGSGRHRRLAAAADHPDVEDLRAGLTQQLSWEAVIKSIVCLAWLAWAQLVVSVGVEASAALTEPGRGRLTAPRIPLARVNQALAQSRRCGARRPDQLWQLDDRSGGECRADARNSSIGGSRNRADAGAYDRWPRRDIAGRTACRPRPWRWTAPRPQSWPPQAVRRPATGRGVLRLPVKHRRTPLRRRPALQRDLRAQPGADSTRRRHFARGGPQPTWVDVAAPGRSRGTTRRALRARPTSCSVPTHRSHRTSPATGDRAACTSAGHTRTRGNSESSPRSQRRRW